MNESKLRILFIAETYPPDYGGGAAIYIRDICRGLALRGHEVRVFCTGNTDQGAYAVDTIYDGLVRIDRVNLPYFRTQDPEGWQLGLLRWLTHQRRIARLINNLLDEWTPDIVQYNAARPLGEECLITLQRRGVPVIAMFHEAWLICPRLMLLRSPTSQACSGPGRLRCLECVYSHYDGSHIKASLKLPWRLLKLGILPAYKLWRRSVARRRVVGGIGYSQFMAKVHQPHLQGLVRYIPLGIDLTDLPIKQPSRPRMPLRFGFVAGFQQNKGIWDVLDAAASLKRCGLTFELHIWGPGQEAGQREIASRELQDRVFLRGTYAPEELWQVYGEIDVAIMATTVCEPFGRVPMEAAAVGAPTIAPAVGGIKETIRDGVDGLLYRFRDPQDLERQMKRVLEDKDLLKNLIENLQPIPDTKTRISEVEDFYFAVLGLTPEATSATVA